MRNIECMQLIIMNTVNVDVIELRRDVGGHGCQHITRTVNMWEVQAVLCNHFICCSNCFLCVLEEFPRHTIHLRNLWPSAHTHSLTHIEKYIQCLKF
jgi:hypothetical protein